MALLYTIRTSALFSLEESVPLRGHIFGGLAGATYRVPLGGHIFGGLAGAIYRVVLGGHILGSLAT